MLSALNAEPTDAAIARADVALYRAKAAGRNRVELPAEAGLPARSLAGEPLALS